MKKSALRSWQERALLRLEEKFNLNGGDHENNRFSIVACPGSGKTRIGTEFIDIMKPERIIVIVPTSALVDQWIMEFARLGISLTPSIYPDFYGEHIDDEIGVVMTYAALKTSEEFLRIYCGKYKTCVIADEMHHVSTGEGKVWGESFLGAFKPAYGILALSGTLWSSDGSDIPFIRYGDDGNCIPDYEYTMKDALEDDTVIPVEFVSHDIREISYINDDYEKVTDVESLRDLLNDVGGAFGRVCRDIGTIKDMAVAGNESLNRMRNCNIFGEGKSGGLVVAIDIKTAEIWKQILWDITKEEPLIVHSQSKDPKGTIEIFTKGKQKWLISVGMVTEGIDIPRLGVCIFATNKLTLLLLLQIIGRILRLWKGSTHKAIFHHLAHPELLSMIQGLEDDISQILKQKKSTEVNSEEPTPCPIKLPRGFEFLGGEVWTSYVKSNDDEYYGKIMDKIETLYRHDKFCIDMGMTRSEIGRMILKGHFAETLKEEEPITEEVIPTHVQRKNLKAEIKKAMNKKLYPYAKNHGIPLDKAYSTAHFNLNRMCGIESHDMANLEKLTLKYNTIRETRVETWL